MVSRIKEFYKKRIKRFFKAVTNLLIFLPYYFSFTTLLKTFFSPWKNIVAKKQRVGFSFNEWLSILSFNLISRGMGSLIRGLTLTLYLIIQTTTIILLPIIFIGYFFLLPVLFFISIFQKTEEERKELLKRDFIKKHLLEKENYQKVVEWFEDYYQTNHRHQEWWRIKNLFSIPPIGKNWAMGYTPILDQYAQDLTDSSYQMRIKNIVDREKEIQQIENALTKTSQANAIIVGEEGVGKHTIIDAFAKKVYQGKINSLLIYHRVLKLNLEKILSQFDDQEKRENFLESLLKEAEQAGNVIIFIDNIERYLTSALPSTIDLTNSIGKFAQSSRLHILGITTPFHYQKFIYPNEKLIRLFEKIEVFEIKKTEAEKIILRAALIFEKRNKIIIPYETIKNLLEKSDFFITYIPFPEKAFELLDTACAYAVSQKKEKILLPQTIDTVLEQKTHIPTELTSEIKHKLLRLEKLLSEKIIYQNHAITQLSSALRRSFILLGKRKKPLASFLFLGPTGVGKTETAKTLAKVFFGSEKSIIRIDMSFYQTKQDIPNLIGSTNSGNPGILTSQVREHPYGVLLIDEIEKADKDLLNIFLTLLDEGYFIDGFGKRVDGKNLIIIATSNAGSDMIYESLKLTPAVKKKNFNQKLISFLINQKVFTPEFLNRFDGVIVYNPLSSQALLTIAKQKLAKIIEDIEQLHKIKIRVSDQFLAKIVYQQTNSRFGARDLQRVIRSQIEDKIARLILEDQIKEGGLIELG